MNDPTPVAAADQQALITRIFDAPLPDESSSASLPQNVRS
jgi:hypothetical protein